MTSRRGLARSGIEALGFAVFAAVLAEPSNAQSQVVELPTIVVRDTFGEVGILEMPSGHMAPDGRLAFSYADVGQQQRYNLNFQALPWMEASFRYSHAVGLFAGYDNNHFYDRSFAVKIRLLRETGLAPDLSVGIRDIIGTGVFGAEYLAASKHIGPFDLTAGMGWGNLAERDVAPNPLGLILPKFKVRPRVNFGVGGLPSFSTYFRGRVGLFGGVIWNSPIEGLSLLTEYSSTTYSNYREKGGIRSRSPVNVGISYHPLESFGLTVGWFYGTTYGVTLTIGGDPTTTYPSAIRVGGPAVPPPAVRSDAEQQSALFEVHQHGNAIRRVEAGGVWVEAPPPTQKAVQDLLQAFLSETHSVRGVEIDGKMLVVDARFTGNEDAQCSAYARIAMGNNREFAGVALTDLQNPDGRVVFCRSVSPVSLTTTGITARIEAANSADLNKRLKKGIDGQAVQFLAASAKDSELWIYYENNRYRTETEAAGRVLRVLMKEAPPSVEIFHLVPSFLGLQSTEITVTRSGLERAESNHTSAEALADAIAVSATPFENPAFDLDAYKRYPQFAWSIDPKLTERVFDPDHPIQFMIYGDAAALLQIVPGLTLSAEGSGTIWSNYTFDRGAGSALPHVRSDVMQYLKYGKYGITNLALTYRTRLAPNVFAETRAGYLEDMFAGAGAQVLWRPEQSRFAFGADVYQVWQRDFNRLFGTQRYNILTGHVSVYYDSPWYGLQYALHAGRYLAGDYGATLQISRRFESGIEVGAWATFTNVPFSKFGEGSFDKGIMIRIPFEWGLPIWSRASYDLQLHSLTRDGGQRLAADDSLYGVTLGSSYGEITEHLDDLVEP